MEIGLGGEFVLTLLGAFICFGILQAIIGIIFGDDNIDKVLGVMLAMGVAAFFIFVY